MNVIYIVGDRNGIKGSGKIVEQKRNVEIFTGIQADKYFSIYLKQGSPQSVLVECDDNLLDIITTDVADGILKIKVEQEIARAKKMNIYITVEDITSLAFSGLTKVYFESDFTTKNDVKINLSSDAKIKNMALTAADVTIKGSSEAKLKKMKITADKATIILLSEAKVKGEIHCKELIVDLSSEAKLKKAKITADKITITSSGEAKTKGEVYCDELKIGLSGEATAKLKGKATNKQVDVRGGAKAKIHNVKGEEATLTATKEGKITIDKKEKSTIKTTKGGKVRVK